MVPLRFYLLETNTFIEQTTNLTKKSHKCGKKFKNSFWNHTEIQTSTMAQKSANYAWECII